MFELIAKIAFIALIWILSLLIVYYHASIKSYKDAMEDATKVYATKINELQKERRERG